MQFGLSNAPAAFCGINDRLFGGLGVLSSVDDFFLLLCRFESHLKHLNNVFWKTEISGIKLKPSQGEFVGLGSLFLGAKFHKTD